MDLHETAFECSPDMIVCVDRRGIILRVNRQAEALLGYAREELIGELRKSLKELKALRGLLPICAHCKRIRDEQGRWEPLESYIHKRSEADFSHGVCPDCVQSH